MKENLFRENLIENQKQFLKRLGSIIKKERIRQGVKRSELAHVLDMTPNYIGYIEQGKYNLSLLKFILITNELGLNPNFVIANSIQDIDIEEKDIAKEIIYILKKATL